MSLLLSTPFVTFFVIAELYFIAALFLSLNVIWCSIPDIDIYLQKYDEFSFSAYSPLHWVWIPVLSFSNYLMNFFGQYIEKTPTDYEMNDITHRGMTHSLWFAISFGFFVAAGFALILLLFMFELFRYETAYAYMNLTELLNVTPLILIPIGFLAGFTSVIFHCVGDIFTPTGIHFLTPRTDYGYTFDLFYAKNEVANRSATPLGLIYLIYSLSSAFAYQEGVFPLYMVFLGYIILTIILIPLWLVFVKTPLGKWFYLIFDLLWKRR